MTRAAHRERPLRAWLRARPADVVDVFVYVVVLNLAVEYIPSVLTESFTHSLLTAVLLKLVLEVVLTVKVKVLDRWRAASTPSAKVLAGVLVWSVVAGSKVVVLEVVGIVFGDSVQLGGVVPVTVLILTLLAARASVRRVLFEPVGADPR